MNNPLAQFWTPPQVAQMMVDLIPKGTRTILEPSCGNGAILRLLPDHAVGLEIDPKLTDTPTDFFDYSTDNKFDCVIMNPPYIRAKNIEGKTVGLSGHANMYAHFIWKSVLHLTENGCIICIVPTEIWYATGNKELNDLMFSQGTVTDLIRFKKSPFLPSVTQEVCIFKWVRGDFSRLTDVREI